MLYDIKDVIASMPAPLKGFYRTEKVWYYWIKNPVGSEAKYSGFATDKTAHYTLDQIAELWDPAYDQVLVLNIKLCNRLISALGYRLGFIDIDNTDSEEFDRTKLDQCWSETWVGYSPSQRGFHALYLIPYGYVFRERSLGFGYGFYDGGNQNLTFGKGANGLDIQFAREDVLVESTEFAKSREQVIEDMPPKNYLLGDGKISVTAAINAAIPIEEALGQAINAGLISHEYGNIYTDLRSASGSRGGIRIYDADQAGRQGQRITYIYGNTLVENEDSSTARVWDAAEWVAYAAEPDKPRNERKAAFAHYAGTLPAYIIKGGVWVTTGYTVDTYNKQAGLQAAGQEHRDPDTFKGEDKKAFVADIFEKLPDEVWAPNDRFGELVRLVDSSRKVPNIATSCVAVIATMCSVTGGRFRGVNEDTLRLYMHCVGGSSSGKGTAISAPKQLGTELADKSRGNTLNYIPARFVSQIASGEGLEDMMHNYPDTVCLWDELGEALGKAELDRSAHVAGVFSYMLRLWSDAGTSTTLRAKAAKQGEEVERKITYAPTFSLFGTATEKSFSEGLNESWIDKGHAGRHIIIPVTRYSGIFRSLPPTKHLEAPGWFVELCQDLHAMVNQDGSSVTGPERVSKPIVLQYTKEASLHIEKRTIKAQAMPDTNPAKIIMTHNQQSIAALATFRGLFSAERVTTVEHVTWAETIVDHGMKYVLSLFEDEALDMHGTVDQAVKRAAGVVKRNQEVMECKLNDAIKNVRSKEKRAYLNENRWKVKAQLIEEYPVVVVKKASTKGRIVSYYVWDA